MRLEMLSPTPPHPKGSNLLPQTLQHHPCAAGIAEPALLLLLRMKAQGIFPSFRRREELGCWGVAHGVFSLTLVNAQDMTPIFSFCL